ncbi:hypothetical protein LC040_03800 [Bacillus tianshenii]|nr:hypothetical protein LC040_03800 [Bacillus tianshenii]
MSEEVNQPQANEENGDVIVQQIPDPRADICVQHVIYERLNQRLSDTIDVNDGMFCPELSGTCRALSGSGFVDEITQCRLELCCLTAEPPFPNCDVIRVTARVVIVLINRLGITIGRLRETLTMDIPRVNPVFASSPNIPVGNIIREIDGSCVDILDLFCNVNTDTGVLTYGIDYNLKLWRHDNMLVTAERRFPDSDVTIKNPFNEYIPCGDVR